MNISKAFADFPNEAAFIARMLAGYTDLEIDLMNCVKASQGGLDTVLKAMYRTRGESLRVGIADAFGRQAYRALGLGVCAAERVVPDVGWHEACIEWA